MSDADAIAALANDRDIPIMLARLPHPYGLDSARKFIAWANERPEGEAVFGIYLRDAADTFAGTCGYDPFDKEEPDLGYWLGKRFWAKGYMSEHAFAVSRHARLHSSCRLPNIASRRILEKAGFERVGLGHMDSMLCGMKVPVDRFLLTRERRERRPG